MKKIKMLLVASMLFIFLAAVPAFAGTCTCGNGRPHDSSHQTKYEPGLTNATMPRIHLKMCQSCINNGHAMLCEQVQLGSENHSFDYKGSGATRTRICYTSGYEEEAVCQHENAYYAEFTNTDKKTCIKYCPDCKSQVGTKSHNFKYSVLENSSNYLAEKHKKKCTDCGYSYLSDHTLKKTYTPMKAPSNFIKELDDLTWPAQNHKCVISCAKCGYKHTVSFAEYGANKLINHVWKDNECTKCGMKRKLLKTPATFSAKQYGKGTATTVKTRAHWVWDGNKLYWVPAGSYKIYGYKVDLKWTKVKGAKGYVVSMMAPEVGDYVQKTGTKSTNYTIHTKLSYRFPVSANKRISSATFYIGAVNEYGFIGKVKKVTAKVK